MKAIVSDGGSDLLGKNIGFASFTKQFHILVILQLKVINIFRVLINGVKPFEPVDHTNTFLERHKACDEDHTPAPRRKPTVPPLLLDDDDAMSPPEDYYDDYEREFEEYDDYDEYETEYIGKSSIF